MAKIHNPQNQDGIPLINQTIFNEEVDALKAADSAEETARKDADDKLQGEIDAEAQTREAADKTLQDNIDAEALARENADTAEVAARNKAIADEVAARNEAISTAITLEVAARDAAIAAEATARHNEIIQETTRASTAEEMLRTKITEEVNRAKSKENEIDSIILGDLATFSTNELVDNTYNAPNRSGTSALNLHHSVIPNGIIKSIEIPDNTGAASNYYLSIKVVDGTTDTVVDYTSTNQSKTKWNFNNFIKPRGLDDSIYFKIVPSNADGTSSNKYFGSLPVNDTDKRMNCGFGGNWPNPNRDLTAENNAGAIGLTRINFEYIPNLNDTINKHAEAEAERIDALETSLSTLATKEEIADLVTEEVVDQKIAAAEHHKPIFDLERNVDRVIFDLSASSEPQSVTLTLSEGKIFAGSVVSSNSAISAAISAINPGVDTSLTINIGLQETPSESTDVFVIVDTICDSVEFNNAQHVAEVIPVQIIVPVVEEPAE